MQLDLNTFEFLEKLQENNNREWFSENKVWYEKAIKEVKAFFQSLVEDEQEHMDMLERQFKSFMSDGKFIAGNFEDVPGAQTAPDILSDAVKKNININGACRIFVIYSNSA